MKAQNSNDEQISKLEYDELTGVYTRQAFYYHAERLLKENPDKRYCLIMSNISDFKLINQKYGDDYANQVLIHGAATLIPLLQAGVPVGRFGGDKFVNLMEYRPETADQEGLIAAISKIKETFPVPGLDLKLGIYNDVDHDVPISVLCDRVMLALRSISHQYGKNIAYYDDAVQRRADLMRQLGQDMEQAYYNEQFQVYYQPKHDAATGKLVGAEALIRWQHPQYGMLLPDDFIPQFERNGFIVYADYYVWRRTCRNLRKWIDDGIDVVPISVNSSRRDYEYPDHLRKVQDALREYSIDPSLLHLEVTETLFTNHIDTLAALIQECRDLGIQVELDDFGTGYSSMSLLGTIPIDSLKLDRSLVSQLQNPKNARVLSACLTLARSLGLKTIAEGIETKEQLDLLRSLRCDSVQGFYYSVPLPEDEFEEYLRACMQREAQAQSKPREFPSGMYVIDEDYHIVMVNHVLKKLYPQMQVGHLCHKDLMGLDAPCDICPVLNHVLGPQTYLDPLRGVYETVQVVDVPLADGRDGHAIVLHTL